MENKTIEQLVTELLSSGLFTDEGEARLFVVKQRRKVMPALVSKPDPPIVPTKKRKRKVKPSYLVTCANPLCGKKFRTHRRNKKYCNQKCNFQAWDMRNPRQRSKPDA